MKKRNTFSEFNSLVVKRAMEKSPPGSPLQPEVANNSQRSEESRDEVQWMLRPDSQARLGWNILTLFLILYQAVFIPLYLGFMLPLEGTLRVAELVVTFLLCCNLPLGFVTTYYENGVLVRERNRIMQHYLREQLWLDFVAFFPFDFLVSDHMLRDEDMSDQSISCATPTRLLIVTRLLGLTKVSGILKSLEAMVSSSLLASFLLLAKKIMLILLIGHFIACFWFFISEMQGSWTQLTWTVRMRREWFHEPSLSEFYVYAVYWTYTVMLTVGFGDIIPQSTAERLYATLCMLIACCVFAYLLGSIGTVVQKQGVIDDQYREQMISMNAFMKRHRFPESLRLRVRQYLKTSHHHMRSQVVDDKKIFGLLSDPLKDEVSACIHGTAVRSYPQFRKLSQRAIALTSRSLRDELFSEGDLLFSEYSHTAKLYYIEQGAVNILHMRTHTLLRTLKEGRYFGQIGYFLRKPRCASAQCVSFVHVLTLDRDSERIEKNEELLSIITAVQMKCSDDDLSELRIRCYLCGTMGHVALACRQEVVNAGGEVVRMQWLAKRKQAHSINPLTCQPNFARKDRKVNLYQRRYSMPNLRLQKKIAAFIGRRASLIETSVPLQEPIVVDSSFRSHKPDLSLYFDSEGSESNLSLW